MKWYRVFKTVLGPIYKFWYNPKIIGIENIPTTGPIILAGNHVHIMDQCNMIISTKRTIHYMAKKEYFDKNYKEGHFAWFFEASECIPVDRSIHDDMAKSKALKVLSKGKVLGIFPEGTRNSLKEDRIKELYDKYYKKRDISYKEFYKKIKGNKKSFIDYLEELKKSKIITKKEFVEGIFNSKDYLLELINKKVISESDYYDHILLPLKFGAVSMASKTNALIIPYGISGDYRFRSKNLRIKIGKPIKVNSDLVKANIKLDKEIKKLIKESSKIM